MVVVVRFEPSGKPVSISSLEDVPLFKACLVVVLHFETSRPDLIAQSIVSQELVITPRERRCGSRMRRC